MRPKLPDYTPHEVVWHQDAGLTAEGKPNTAPVQDRMNAFGPGIYKWYSDEFAFKCTNLSTNDARYLSLALLAGKTVNCWTPLVPVTKENGAMKFLPGSHKLGIQKHVLLRQYR